MIRRWCFAVIALAMVGCPAERYPYGRPPYEAEADGGCALQAAGAGAFVAGFDLRDASGDPMLDTAVVHEGRVLNDVFGVRPGLIYFVEAPEMGANAFATPALLLEGEHDGTVLLGLRLITAEQGQPDWGAALNGIMAHEWAHIVQQRDPWLRIMPVPWKELHADFLAGWYLGLRSLELEVPIDGFGRSVFDKGDFGFYDPNHHGTPDQRATMMFEGWTYARNSSERGLRAALRRGASHLRFRGNFVDVIASR